MNAIKIFFIIILSAIQLRESSCNNIFLVDTDVGSVRGQFRSYNGQEFRVFYGIPYAEAPIGPLRFKPPVPKQPWDGIRNATYLGPKCMQPSIGLDEMSEDCLYLNIFTPNHNNHELLPVYFFIHGGEFRKGSSNEFSLGPEDFMKKGVVLVTINYRLGAFGFLSLNIADATGNNGIKDALCALRWISKNIANFGGDPNRITLGGFSAGSVLINYAQHIEKFNGLYQQVILESGSALGFRFFNPDPIKAAIDLGNIVCGETSNRTSLLNCLLLKNATEILKAQIVMGDQDKSEGFRPYTPFIPTLEKDSSHSVINQKPSELFRQGPSQHVPILVGLNCEEGAKNQRIILSNRTLLDMLNEDNTRYVPSDLSILTKTKRKNIAAKIKQFYFAGGNITDTNIDRYFDLITDTHYGHSVNYWLEQYKAMPNSAKVYFYQFCFDGAFNRAKLVKGISYPGAIHGDQAGYIFRDDISQRMHSADKRSVQKRNIMITLWTNFIKYGNPTPDGSLEVQWHPSEYPKMNHFFISDVMVNIDHKPFHGRTQFWKGIYDSYYAMLCSKESLEVKESFESIETKK